MLRAQTSPEINEFDLARAFLAALVAEAASSGEPHNYSAVAIDELLGKQGAPSALRDEPTIRPSLAACAVAVAASICGEKGLLHRLREDSPIIVFQPGPWTEGDVGNVLYAAFCAGATKDKNRTPIIQVRDGSHKNHNPDQGNDDVLDAISGGCPLIAISRDPKRYLPSLVHEAVEHSITVPTLTVDRLALVLEAICGGSPESNLSSDIVASLRPTDLDICVRPRRSADECVEQLSIKIARRRAETLGPYLEDLPGYTVAKVWGLELIADVNAYRLGKLVWRDFDHTGLLLAGPPGVGKTQFARALARSARVPLIETSASDWNSANYLSGTLQAIKSAFARARAEAPSLLFIDECDAISSREKIAGDYREYWVQIVNAVLQELTSEENVGVIVLAATNYPERIDPAIRRAGRLDYQITLELPTIAEMEAILRFHLGDNLAGSDLLGVATLGAGASGADAFAWVTRARAAARRLGRALELTDLTSAIRGDRADLPPEVRHRIAIHEAGHAMASLLLREGKIDALVIKADGGAAHIDFGSSAVVTASTIDRRICVLLAGRAAEALLLGEPSIGPGVGPGSDLEVATGLAIALETRYGAGTIGLVHAEHGHIDILRNPELIGAVKARLAEAEERASALLANRLPALLVVAAELEKKSCLSGAAVESLLACALEAS